MKNIFYVISIIAALSLLLAVSCSKKEEARKTESRVQAVELLPEAAPRDIPAEVQIEVAETPVKESAPGPGRAVFVPPSLIGGPAAAPVPVAAPAQTAPPVKTAPPARAAPDAAIRSVSAPRQAAPAPAAESASKLIIEHISGPKQVYAGQEITLRCSVKGVGAVSGYIWRFQNGGDAVERKTGEPQVKVTFDKTGDYAITCDVVETGRAGKALASQQFKIRVVSGRLSVNAGGPYNAMMNKPAKFLGNAASNTGKIALYEWFFGGGEKPAWSGAENAVVQHTFAKSGNHQAVFRVTLADGASVSDTAVVYVGSVKPAADAGPDIVSYPNRKAKLNGTGRSPDGSIVKYEWDFDGDGVFDWSSAKTGAAAYNFKTYSYPVFRVTDTEGNTAVDTARVVVCPGDMVTVERGKFCADRYEWPNKRGGIPATNISWQEAAIACESAGKRLCSSDEWQRTCRNDNSLKEAGPGAFPYGREFDDQGCNTLGNPKAPNKLIPSGSLGACTGAGGAFDMSGNAAEWAAAPDGGARAHGGFYQSGQDASDCDSYVTLEKDRKYLYVGFRCCK